jgi:protein-disulfide isomerase
MHDLLFQNTRTLKRNHLDAYAKKLGLNMSSFKSALDSGTYKAQVDADMAVGRRVGVSGTPTIFVNGRKLMQNISFKAFQSLINPMLLKKGYKKADLPSGPPPVEVKLHGGEAWKGGKNAPVTIVEFSDFQCPFCSRGANTIEQVAKAYGNKVKLVFKHFPLNFHKDAPLAAQAAMAAQAQGKFWQMHDKLFANIRKLKRPDLERYAKELGLDMVKFKNALDAQAYKPVLDADMREGRAVGISGTPGFFINGQKISGAQPFNKFMNVINAILLKKGYKRADLPSGPPAK